MSKLLTEALLLRCVDFSESDRVVHLLTPDLGRLTAIAKGARRSVKRFPGTLDVFNHVRIQLFANDLQYGLESTVNHRCSLAGLFSMRSRSPSWYRRL